ncbi:phage major capsid protein, P2 family [Psychrobacter sp. CAM01]|uniref:phage major capsid protein, P2 family n=1 Tax=unclassified Psychrobacter TaxID=196806 RepID=UPI001917C628|nr:MULTISPECIES: phage major capsid protein, P2 family [unclassified Psychrobacter]MDN5665925.1 phage major capsid protein, P2 family [Psychrobacter sp.]MDV2859117.1 phage major capsid protein, P2 family [Psychrobacter sp. CAM01]
MKNTTRQQFNGYLANQAELNGVPSATEQYTVEPSVQQKVETRVQESSEFLKKINVIPVTDQKGEALGLGISGGIASRTNTKNGKRREPKNVGEVGPIYTYVCEKTDFDTAIPYNKLDSWARDPKFQEKIRDAVLKQQALDRITVGFNGTHVAADTDIDVNPLLQDVNIGWLQKYRDNAPESVMTESEVGTSKVSVGASATSYKNLDALVKDCVDQLIDPIVRDDSDLRVILGRDLKQSRDFNMVNDNNTPSEVIAVNSLLMLDKVGGITIEPTPPNFPADGILITPLDNLSIYYQEGSRRRNHKDEPEYDRVAFYESDNEAYVVENYKAGCLIENVELV